MRSDELERIASAYARSRAAVLARGEALSRSEQRVLETLQALQERHPDSPELQRLVSTYLYLMSQSSRAAAVAITECARHPRLQRSKEQRS